MRVGIPVDNRKVCSNFEAAGVFILCDFKNGELSNHTELKLDGDNEAEYIVELLLKAKVDLIICDKIEMATKVIAEQLEIKVIPEIQGSIEDVVTAFDEASVTVDI